MLREGRAASPAPPPPVAPAAKPAAAKPEVAKPEGTFGPGVARVLTNALGGERRLDALLEAAARGRTFTASELLAMQTTVFRYSQTVELLSRATDRLVGAVKQTLGTPV